MVTLGKSFLIKIYTENIQRTGHRKLKKQCNVREQKDYICESIFSYLITALKDNVYILL